MSCYLNTSISIRNFTFIAPCYKPINFKKYISRFLKIVYYFQHLYWKSIGDIQKQFLVIIHTECPVQNQSLQNNYNYHFWYFECSLKIQSVCQWNTNGPRRVNPENTVHAISSLHQACFGSNQQRSLIWSSLFAHKKPVAHRSSNVPSSDRSNATSFRHDKSRMSKAGSSTDGLTAGHSLRMKGWWWGGGGRMVD